MKICWYCGAFGLWGNLSPSEFFSGKKMFAGGETALLYQTLGLAAKGHDVTVCGNVKEGVECNVKWIAKERLEEILLDYWDVFISCDDPSIFGRRPRARIKIADFACNHFGIGPELDSIIDYYAVRSDWHARQIRRADSTLPIESGEKFLILPYGIDPKVYDRSYDKMHHRIIYASSPDRGLHHLLRFFPRIRQQVPDTELHVFYSIAGAFEGWKYGMDTMSENMWNVYRGLVTHPSDGVIYHGPVPNEEFVNLVGTGELMVYPCDTLVPTEGFSIATAIAFATKMAVVLADCDCMQELWG